jgi:hypothetical protein
MTPAELAALTARANRIERIIKALQAFEGCEHDHEHAAAERELKAALASHRLPAAPGPNKSAEDFIDG